MDPMREFETENVTPESERAVEVRDRETGVIDRSNAKVPAHALQPNDAITLSSIAIGVGNAPISTVVRVGFGFPSPAK